MTVASAQSTMTFPRPRLVSLNDEPAPASQVLTFDEALASTSTRSIASRAA
jgi:hypothetical protein